MPIIYCQDKIFETIICHPLLLYFIHGKANMCYLFGLSAGCRSLWLLDFDFGIFSITIYYMDDKMSINDERCSNK